MFLSVAFPSVLQTLHAHWSVLYNHFAIIFNCCANFITQSNFTFVSFELYSLKLWYIFYIFFCNCLPFYSRFDCHIVILECKLDRLFTPTDKLIFLIRRSDRIQFWSDFHLNQIWLISHAGTIRIANSMSTHFDSFQKGLWMENA